MADQTYSFKASEETIQKVKGITEATGISVKEYFERAVSLMELQNIKQGAAEFTQDLNELQVHTTRIYELISNMVQRSIHTKDAAVREVADQLEKKEFQNVELQERIRKAQEAQKELKDYAAEVEKANDSLLKQMADLRASNESNMELVQQYKEKIDMLSGELVKFKNFADENEELKQQIERKNSSLQEMKETNRDQEAEISQLNGQIERLNNDHAIELERLAERKDTEKAAAIIELREAHQQKLIEANDKYNEQLRAAFADVSKIREEYEAKIEKLQAQQQSRRK